MSNLSKVLLSAAVLCGLTACAAPVEETKSTTLLPRATVKPGANVTLNTVKPKSMTSDSFQTVRLDFTDGYPDGTLSVTLEPSTGLRLFGGQSSKTFDMSKPGLHSWDVDVSAEADGVYFLNVFANANGAPRSFSVSLNVGEVSQKMLDEAMPQEGTLMDGGKVRVLEATETIR